MPKHVSPLFCPRCVKPRPIDDWFGNAACPACGERLVPQGYCPVCDDYWPLAVETPCPKHDLALEPGPPERPRLDSEGAPVRWVTVGQFADSQAAQAPRIRLEAEGIPTFLEGERMASRSMYAVATGGARLKVPEHLAADARILLSQTWKATAAELDIEELPDHEFSDPDGHEAMPAAPSRLRDGLLVFLIVGLPLLLALGQFLRHLAMRP